MDAACKHFFPEKFSHEIFRDLQVIDYKKKKFCFSLEQFIGTRMASRFSGRQEAFSTKISTAFVDSRKSAYETGI